MYVLVISMHHVAFQLFGALNQHWPIPVEVGLADKLAQSPVRRDANA
jgi:hypothetical protein